METFRKFFLEQDDETKLKYTKVGQVPQGYAADKTEVLYGDTADHKESVTANPGLYNQMIEDGVLDKVAIEMWDQLVQFEQDILRAYALAIQQPEDFFAQHAGPVATEQTMSALRVLHYPAHDEDAKEMKCSPHTDFGLATLLFQDQTGGLQLWNRNTKAWEPITPIPGTMVVNTGNLMQRWTNDLFFSSLHRVMPNPDDSKTRMSIVFFGTANVGTICDPKDMAKEMHYEPIDAAAFYKDLVDEAYKEEGNVQLIYGAANEAFTAAQQEENERRSKEKGYVPKVLSDAYRS